MNLVINDPKGISKGIFRGFPLKVVELFYANQTIFGNFDDVFEMTFCRCVIMYTC